MILAAGFGERMRPLTDKRPKPSLPVLGMPLLSRIIHEIRRRHVALIAVNGHHHSPWIRKIARKSTAEGTPISFFHESSIMGTGGALVAPSKLLGRTPFFLTHNGDTLCRIPLQALRRALDDDTVLGALLVRPGRHESYGPILTRGGFFRALGSERKAPSEEFATFLGVALWKREVLDRVPRARASDILRDTVLPMLDERHRLAVVPHSGPWLEFTSPKSYRKQVCSILAEDGMSPADLPGGSAAIRNFQGARVYIAPSADVSPHCRLEGQVAVESGAVIRSGAVVADSVILEDSTVESDVTLRKVVLSSGSTARSDHHDGVI